MHKRLLPCIAILVLLLCFSQLAMAGNTDATSVQEELTNSTNAEENTVDTVSDVGWPAHYGGVMLQGFYWGSFDESSWDKLGSADTVALYSKYFERS